MFSSFFQTAEGKVGEYEQQLAALLNSLEDQQRLSEQQTRELEESQKREKDLLREQKRLETQCTQQDEQIHNLSLNLSKMSHSMVDVTAAPNHSTPVRNAKSEYFADDVNVNEDDEGGYGGVRPFNNQQQVSHVSPMPRGGNLGSTSYSEESNLVDHDKGVNHSYAEGSKYIVGGADIKNVYYNTPEGRNNRSEGGGFDNVGVVRPNNTRTVVDVEMPSEPIREVDIPKKKKKGIMKVFKLCTGKSGQSVARSDSTYVKREPARVTMTTYSNEQA